mgnify:FL=1
MLLSRKSLLSAPDVRTLQTLAASHLRDRANAVLVAWYYPSNGQIGQTDRIEGLLCPTDGITESLRQAMQETARRACRSNEVCLQYLQSAAVADFPLVAVPVPAFPGQCLLALLESHSQNTGVS